MSLRIHVAGTPGQARVAVLRDGALEDYAIWRQGAPDGVGDIHRGRVRAIVPAMAGAFVALAGAEGFLPDTAGAAGRGVGDAVLIRVVRAALGGKGPRLAAADAAGLAAAGPPALLRAGPNPVERLAALYPDAEIGIDDPALRAALRPVLGARAVAAARFDDTLEAEIEALAATMVALPGGGALHIHPTPALCAIDIDTGAASGARASKPAAQLALNLAALAELARQIRLRNLGGAILVDFAGMAVRRRPMLAEPLTAALAADPLRPRLLGFTQLGLAEILRPVVHPPLHEVLAGPHAAGLAALAALARDCAARPALRPVLRAAPDIVSALHGDGAALAAFARATGRALELRADPTMTGWATAGEG